MTIRALALAAILFTSAVGVVAQAATAPTAAAGPAKLTELIKIDQAHGTGRVAASGDTVTIHYTGWLYAPKARQQRGPRFDHSTDGQPYTFKLGAGTVIKGWDEGVRGMRVGGKRTLLVPASMGFGKEGLGPVPSTASLIFEIELIAVK